MSRLRVDRWSKVGLLIFALLLSLLLPVRAQEIPSLDAVSQSGEAAPLSQVHPLPATLVQWREQNAQGDYFEQIAPTTAGYLIWSRFPVRVFIEPSNRSNWVIAVQQAVSEWNQYLPLTQVDRPEIADIVVWCRTPPLRFATGRSTELGRVRSAETRYEIGIDRPAAAPATLTHRFQIWLRPDQTATYLQAAARHELGHALGIWGHSLEPTDALYFSQVRTPASISTRDINTLKRIYQQPTQLGWPLTASNRDAAQ